MDETRPPRTDFDEVLYADDNIIFSKGSESVEKLLHEIEECEEPYGLKLNQDKCETICTDPYKTYKIKTRKKQAVKFRKEAKYLGCKNQL